MPLQGREWYLEGVDSRVPLVGLTAQEIAERLAPREDARWRAKQIAKWVYGKAVADFDAMRDLPATLRAELAEAFTVDPLTVARHAKSSDGVEKLLVHRGDGQVYECVLLPYEDRVSCCLSSQVGCPMGCTFCATGLGGFDRNLSAAEIVGQYLLLQRLTTRRIGHVVFMGMGEPLLNLDNVVKAIGLLHDEVGLSLRHITVSTVGLVPQIRKLSQTGLPIHLALSLHAARDEVRERLMPVNKKWPVAEVVSAMRAHQKATGRKVTFEVLLIADVNDSTEDAAAMSRLVRGFPCIVNLIPFNYVDTEQGFRRPSANRIRAFRGVLESAGVTVTQRVERGHDIAAACGQLAGEHVGRFAKRGVPLGVR